MLLFFSPFFCLFSVFFRSSIIKFLRFPSFPLKLRIRLAPRNSILPLLFSHGQVSPARASSLLSRGSIRRVTGKWHLLWCRISSRSSNLTHLLNSDLRCLQHFHWCLFHRTLIILIFTIAVLLPFIFLFFIFIILILIFILIVFV